MKFQIVPVTPFQQNCSLIWDEQTMKGAVVDPGGDLDRILAAVESKGVTVEKILITHGHLDHAGHAAELARRLSVKIEGPHKDEIFWLERLGNDQGRMFGFPPGEVFTPDRWLEDGDTITVGSETLQVFHCPGHTPSAAPTSPKATTPTSLTPSVASSSFCQMTSSSSQGTAQCLQLATRRGVIPLSPTANSADL
jgi:glyoxylase-like metal-dependent hydrolase (beta-lactamase superfamily II)